MSRQAAAILARARAAAVREKHRKVEVEGIPWSPNIICYKCCDPWPCDAIALAELLEAAAVELERLGQGPRHAGALYDENGRQLSIYDLCEWWHMTYPSDIFVNGPSEIVQIRSLMRKVLDIRDAARPKE